MDWTHIYLNAFLAGLNAFLWPYHLTSMVIIGDFFFFSYGFSMKLHAEIYHGSYDKSIDIKYAATSY